MAKPPKAQKSDGKAQAVKAPDAEPPDFVIAEPYLFGILALGIINGIFSPALLLALVTKQFWYPFFLPETSAFVTMFASLIVSTLTIMLAGVPAALYERFVGGGKTSLTSLWIWISALAFLSMPAILNLLRVGLF